MKVVGRVTVTTDLDIEPHLIQSGRDTLRRMAEAIEKNFGPAYRVSCEPSGEPPYDPVFAAGREAIT